MLFFTIRLSFFHTASERVHAGSATPRTPDMIAKRDQEILVLKLEVERLTKKVDEQRSTIEKLVKKGADLKSKLQIVKWNSAAAAAVGATNEKKRKPSVKSRAVPKSARLRRTKETGRLRLTKSERKKGRRRVYTEDDRPRDELERVSSAEIGSPAIIRHVRHRPQSASTESIPVSTGVTNESTSDKENVTNDDDVIVFTPEMPRVVDARTVRTSGSDPRKRKKEEEEEKKKKARPRTGKKQSRAYKFVDVVRGKEKRAALRGHKCPRCEEFFEAMQDDQLDLAEFCRNCSRHRQAFTPEHTPEGFWEIGFPDSVPDA